MQLISTAVLAIPPTYRFQTGLGTDDVGGDSDTFMYVTGTGLFSQGISRNQIIDYRAELSLIEYSDNDDRSGEEIFLEGIYSYTPTSGFQVPTYSVGLRHVEEMADASALDASTTTLLAFVTYRIDDRSTILGGIQLSDRDSSDDATATNYFVTVDYRLDSKWILYATLNIADEEIDAEDSGNQSSAPNIAVRPAIAGGHLPSEGGGAAVSDESDNTFITIGGSYVLNARDTLAASISNREYDTTAGTVDGNVISFDFFHQF
ncbi:MAG: hypothetical protein AAF353_13715 [Pseudomonadota bacterium]